MSRAASECNVLIVEDDSAIRRLVTTVLKRAGYSVETAMDGIEAVLKLGLNDFDVIVLDLMMPRLDGFTFLETMEANDPARLRKIIVTSAASPALLRERLARRPFAILPKPFDVVNLTKAVRECIDRQDTTPAPQTEDGP